MNPSASNNATPGLLVVVFDRGRYINLKQLLYLIALFALKEKGIKLSAHN